MSRADRLVAQLAAAGCVYAAEEAALLREAARDEPHLEELVARRVDGVPLEQVVGWALFRGLRVAVTPGVFVPRRRTELLVEVAVAALRPGDRVVDLCCGSGAVAAALLHEAGPLRMHAVDLDPVAVACAEVNLDGTGAQVHTGDLVAPLPASLRGGVDLLVASPPYVPTAEVALLPREARDHEPLRALDGGPEGTALHLRILAAAPRWLRPGGRVLLELGAAQADSVTAAAVRAGLAAAVHRCEARDATVAEGLLPAAGG